MFIVVDTSIWIDFFAMGEPPLFDLIAAKRAMIHPMTIGEIAVGGIPRRRHVLDALLALPRLFPAIDDDVLRMIEEDRLHGQGLGYIDVHILAAVRLTPGTLLWTRDRRLRTVAANAGVAAPMDTRH